MEPDIEFGKETFDKMKSNLGKQDREQFDDWVNSEKYELEASLGGQENMANFTYAGMEEKEINPAISDISILAEVCLRDACVLNYRHAYNKQGPLWQKVENIEDHSATYYLSELDVASKLVQAAVKMSHKQ